ncbi:hypothetical protein EJ02DRAFT_452840 [Clathrospora elynae]|uniref:Uncharacterized protein n=1 Tax=Clathrospora elynae TaxID=706981 RepID=A0A6A5SXE1_9PLEO|nr:hypothetical protein EJ02DRAFT_452840 [Clathrospora elynae]
MVTLVDGRRVATAPYRELIRRLQQQRNESSSYAQQSPYSQPQPGWETDDNYSPPASYEQTQEVYQPPHSGRHPPRGPPAFDDDEDDWFSGDMGYER